MQSSARPWLLTGIGQQCWAAANLMKSSAQPCLITGIGQQRRATANLTQSSAQPWLHTGIGQKVSAQWTLPHPTSFEVHNTEALARHLGINPNSAALIPARLIPISRRYVFPPRYTSRIDWCGKKYEIVAKGFKALDADYAECQKKLSIMEERLSTVDAARSTLITEMEIGRQVLRDRETVRLHDCRQTHD